jgi:hypothetical protein
MFLLDKVNAGGPLRDASIDLARAQALTEEISLPVTCTPAVGVAVDVTTLGVATAANAANLDGGGPGDGGDADDPVNNEVMY